MDALGDATLFGIIASIITSIIEIIKAWIPQKNKDDKGLVFTRKNGKKIHIPNQAVWPLASLLLGIAIFFAIQYDPFAQLLGVDNGGEALGGAFTALGAQGVYRVKNAAGSKVGGNDATRADKVGPEVVTDPVLGEEQIGPCVEEPTVDEFESVIEEPVAEEPTPEPVLQAPEPEPQVPLPIAQVFIPQEDSALVF